MNPPIDIYCGSPVEIDSERIFLGQLREDLASRKRRALIFANFCPDKNPLQIDFFVVTEAAACHVELKNLTAPVVGRINGPWHLVQPDGSRTPLGEKNPYRQALDGKFAISDEMHRFARRTPAIPAPSGGGKFYTQFESVVCVYPDLLPGSAPFEDFKVRVRGYTGLLTFLDSGTRTPGWSWDDWLGFAMHMSLVKVTEHEATVPPAVREATAAVNSYTRLYEDFHGRDLDPLVPTGLTGSAGPVSRDDLAAMVSAGRHVQLLGPSGFGKTLAARHLGLAALQAGRIPVFVSARDYEGRLSALLDRGVAHLHPDTSLSLLNAAASVGRSVTLILDGFNECPRKRRGDLLRDLQAFYLRWRPALLVTAQEQVGLGEPLAAEIVTCEPLALGERESIVRAYLGDRDPADILPLCDAFRSPYELSVAAACAGHDAAPPTRAGLFNAFVQERCGAGVTGAGVRVALRAVAGEMSRQLSGSLPAGDVWRVIETGLSAHGLPLTHAPAVFDSGLVTVRQGRCSFRHELLEQFFKAEWLRRSHSEAADFARALARPRFRPLAELAMGVESDAFVVRTCLDGLADPAAYSAALLGQWGETARTTAAEMCVDLIRRADAVLDEMEVTLIGKEGNRLLRVTGGHVWSSSETAMLQALAGVTPTGLFLREVMALARRTEERCCELLLPHFGRDGVLPRVARAELFAGLFSWSHQGDALPAISSVAGTLQSWYPARGQETPGLLSPWLDRLDELCAGELLFLCRLLRGAGPEADRAIARVLICSWRTGAYHLRLEALKLAEGFAWRLKDADREGVTDFLSGLESSNLFLSSAIVEALSVYGLLTPPVSQEVANAEVAAVLAGEDCEGTRHQAYLLASRIFEDVFQDVYYHAIETLEAADRARFLTLAALGAPSHSSTPDWALSELRRYDDAVVLPAFQHFASSISGEAFSPQEAVSCFATAAAGCARFLDSPVPLRSPTTDEGKAWEAYGAILFWLAKPGLAEERCRAACMPLWGHLETDYAFEAVDPLYRMDRAGWLPSKGLDRPLEILSRAFPEEVRRLLEFGVQHHARLTSIFHGTWGADDRRVFLVKRLGDLGTARTARLLEPWSDDPTLGTHVVEAIRKLKANTSSA